jgi:benzoyl-CoA reductase subunit C
MTAKGLARVQEIYQDRSRRAKELQSQGKKVIGYPCVYVPLELLTALDVIPYRIYGEMREPVTEADRVLPASFCPIMRSCLDCALKGKHNFLNGMVALHASDPQEKTARIWQSYTTLPYFHFIDMPGTVLPEAVTYFTSQLKGFVTTLESLAGRKLPADSLRKAIEAHNQQRTLVQSLFHLTKSSPPLVSGTEIVQVVKAVMSLPVDEGNQLLTEVIDEVKERKDKPPSKRARLLLWGSTTDNADVMAVLESNACVVFAEDCGGYRPYRGSVKLTSEPLNALADYYLNEITCARTFRQTTTSATQKDYLKDLQSRYGYLKRIIADWKVDGVVLLLVRYCDPFAFEVPAVRDYLASISVPSTYIEYDYTEGSLAPMRTRIEAFLETIG